MRIIAGSKKRMRIGPVAAQAVIYELNRWYDEIDMQL
jgi:hypothetical protein